MTAIVGILNKKGIAIAADSAVTFSTGNDTKILNSGDKMLRLKDGQRVAVMIVNNSHLCLSLYDHLHWDVIIRWYRKQHDSTGFPKFVDYIEDFMEFVNSDILTGSENYKPSESTHLVFAGYGETDSYPSICSCEVQEVKNGKLCWTPPQDLKTISDNMESTVFSLGDADIIGSILFGIQIKRIDSISQQFSIALTDLLYQKDLYEQALNVDHEIIVNKVKDLVQEHRVAHFKQWLEVIKKYSLQEMAALAENLIKATELHRKITFQQENVGGLVDLALITRNDGFQWLNRKSWYEPSRGGQYGKFGI